MNTRPEDQDDCANTLREVLPFFGKGLRMTFAIDEPEPQRLRELLSQLADDRNAGPGDGNSTGPDGAIE
jgi:hypothetical protein